MTTDVKNFPKTHERRPREITTKAVETETSVLHSETSLVYAERKPLKMHGSLTPTSIITLKRNESSNQLKPEPLLKDSISLSKSKKTLSSNNDAGKAAQNLFTCRTSAMSSNASAEFSLNSNEECNSPTANLLTKICKAIKHSKRKKLKEPAFELKLNSHGQVEEGKMASSTPLMPAATGRSKSSRSCRENIPQKCRLELRERDLRDSRKYEKRESVIKPSLSSLSLRKTQSKNSPDSSNSISNLKIKQSELSESKRNFRLLEDESTNLLMEHVIQNNEKSSSIKVYARFRPFSSNEKDLFNHDQGQSFCSFHKKDTVVLEPENFVFTLDRVFPPDCDQAEVFENMGVETINDVMSGYNGTIFAYGQTGSGKTYTMFGDMINIEKAGIIPRSIRMIFQMIEDCELDVEYTLNCSMLEIYKETISDLLCKDKTDLKIKESPVKGIYVQGLSQISVGSEEELCQLVELGEQSRKVAATRINQYSTRSHCILMLEIKQKFPNDVEKIGKLNLVDLAGSEKVSKSGVIGVSLEEAKKINLSLTCLGKVIYALTSNCDHIPYRDSKLTRILQESLGGNFKTSLIVTCSTHSSSTVETISTLKFASRAKTIKNCFKMNIKDAPETLHKLIAHLKAELKRTKEENIRIRDKEVFGHIHGEDERDESDAVITKKKQQEEISLLEVTKENELLNQKLDSKQREIESLNQSLSESLRKQKQVESELVTQRTDYFNFEKKIIQIQEERDIMKLKYETRASDINALETRLEIQKQKIDVLKESLKNTNDFNTKILGEKKSWVMNGYEELMKIKNLPFLEMTLSDYPSTVKKNAVERRGSSFLRTTEKKIGLERDLNAKPGDKDSATAFLHVPNLLKRPSKNLRKIMEVQLDSGENAKRADQRAKPRRKSETYKGEIFFLKNQILRAYLVNQNLERALHELEWNQIIENGKAKINSEILKIQKNMNSNLETIIEKSQISHGELRNRLDLIELELIGLREKLYNANLDSSFNVAGRRSRITRTISKKNLCKHGDKSYDETTNMGLEDAGQAHSGKENYSQQLLYEMFLRGIHKQLEDNIEIGPLGPAQNVECINNKNRHLRDVNAKILEFIANHNSLTAQTKENKDPALTPRPSHPNVEENRTGGLSKEDSLKSENTRLQSKLLIVLSELETERCKSEMLQETYEKCVIELHKFQTLVEEIQNISVETLKKDFESWQSICFELKKTLECEIHSLESKCRKYRAVIEEKIPDFNFNDADQEEVDRRTNEVAKRMVSIQPRKVLRELSSNQQMISKIASSPLLVRFSETPTDIKVIDADAMKKESPDQVKKEKGFRYVFCLEDQKKSKQKSDGVFKKENQKPKLK